jgi:D-alanyl-D-alanine carboxypeptidase (penicillin-binding protein 5/6)
MGTYYHIDYGTSKKTNLRLYVFLICFAIIGTASYFYYPQPETTVNANQTVAPTVSAEKPKQTITAPMPWPSYGHAAYSVKEGDTLATSESSTKPVPIASLTKVITALAVLEQKPLKPGEKGPMITLDEQDAALYGKYLQKNGSVLPAATGQQISQHDALQAMLMVSANNISDILARWAFGSVEEYTEYANAMVRGMGLEKTTVDDASGFSPHTVSTAQEMTQLGILYMENPVLKNIALKQEANIPIFGTVPNYNSLVDGFGMTGIKVGDTDEAGRCFMAADIRGDTVSVAVVLGADNFTEAIQDAQAILKAGNNGYDQTLTRE